MKIKTRWVVVFVFAFSFLVCQQVKAAAITGKVVEVNEGDEITIFNLNRKVRIKLMAIDAPEKDQAFGAAAKQHLFDLVNDKFVSVEYQGVGQHSILIGRVLAEGNDICAQMIRDGAAWFDASNQNLLTQEQREIYYQSEQAARSEKRGLWQGGDAIAPWEFVKAQELKKASTPTTAQSPASSNAPPKSVKPAAELTSMGLLRTSGGVAKPLGTFEDMSFADGTIARTWKRFQPEGENFSVMVPDGGKIFDLPGHLGEENYPIHAYVVKEGNSVYQVLWVKVPLVGYTDFQVLDRMFREYQIAAGEQSSKIGVDVRCEPTAVRNISTKGYAGKEFDLTQCALPQLLRYYTKMVDGERYIYGAFAVFKEEDENVTKFLKSFTLDPKSASTRTQ